MYRTTTSIPLLLFVFALSGAAVLGFLCGPQTDASDLTEPVANGETPDPNRIEGHAKCVDCHKTEVRALLASKHATRAFDLLRTAPTAKDYAEKLGIAPQDIARNSLCVNCHATPRRDEASGRLTVLPSVSCEACHNPAGGASGWLNAHAVYGPTGTRREQESAAHYRQRAARCRDAGQLRSTDLYALAKRCFACHVVGDEKLAEAGHDHGNGFELAAKTSGEVRHNFLLDPRVNAEAPTLWTDPLHHGAGRNAAGRKRVMFVVGQLVDLETSLRSLATATAEGDFSDLLVGRIEDAYELLSEDLLDEAKNTDLPEVKQAVAAVEPVWKKLDDDGFSPDDRQLYRDAAERVAQAAREFAQRDGNNLVEIDELRLLPEGPFEGLFQP